MSERSQTAPSASESRQLFKAALRYMSPFKREFLVKVALMLASIMLLLVLPWPIKLVIDHVILRFECFCVVHIDCKQSQE